MLGLVRGRWVGNFLEDPRILCSSLLMCLWLSCWVIAKLFHAPRSPLLTSIPLLNTNSTLLLIIVDMQKKKKIKKLPPLKVYLQEIKLLVSYIPLFVVWFAPITILTPTDIQIKDRITSFPIKISFVLFSSPFFCFFNPFSSALIDTYVRFDALIPALPHNLILNL